MKKYSVFMAAMLALAGPAAAGELQYRQVTGSELRNLFEGQTLIGEYRMGDINAQYTEYHYKDGTTEYIASDSPPTHGTWDLVGDDKVCYRYPNHETLTDTYCFFTYKLGSCYYSYAQPDMSLKGPKSWDKWASRAVPKGSGGSCAAQVS